MKLKKLKFSFVFICYDVLPSNIGYYHLLLDITMPSIWRQRYDCCYFLSAVVFIIKVGVIDLLLYTVCCVVNEFTFVDSILKPSVVRHVQI